VIILTRNVKILILYLSSLFTCMI